MWQYREWPEDHALASREHLKFVFLIPLGLVIATITALLVGEAYSGQREEIERAVSVTDAAMRESFGQAVEGGLDTLGAAMALLRANQDLRTALARRDRGRLLHHSEALMQALRAHGITHWYFTDTQRNVVLRVHTPQLHGDRIGRYTMQKAARTGEAAAGLELGKRGSFTLRRVEPWYDTAGVLIGYVELGSGIERVLRGMEHLLGVRLYLLTRTQYLTAVESRSGWTEFPAFVIARGAMLPAALAAQLRADFPRDGQVFSFHDAARTARAVMMHIPDAAGRPVAGILAVLDVTAMEQASRRILLQGGIIGTLAGGLLLALFSVLLSGIERRLRGHAARLRELATRDELTGLFNRRSFYARLHTEMRRAARYGHHLSLLLIDIDYFKAVNDNYGHRTGDEVLKAVAHRIQASIRTVDTAFRYGGEELLVLLPETPLPDALEIAERIRTDIATRPFASVTGESLWLSVSIGGASYPERGGVDALLGAADRAMYAAKAAGRNQVCRDSPSQ